MKIKFLLIICLISIEFLGCGNNQKSSYMPLKVSSENGESVKNKDTLNYEDEDMTDTGDIIKEDSLIYVYICGEINKAGVYKISDKSRLYELVDLAGGLKSTAAEYLNMAEKLYDGEKIDVLSKEEYDALDETEKDNLLSPPSVTNGNITENTYSDNEEELIDINTADKEELVTLPGIGENKAEQIIKYRQENGLFNDPEDIKNVSGIGDASYEKIKEHIKVR